MADTVIRMNSGKIEEIYKNKEKLTANELKWSQEDTMLYKSVFKTFKKKWAQILAIGLVIFISSFIYTVMAYAIDGLKKPTEEFFKGRISF